MPGAAAPVDLLVVDPVAERHGTYHDLLGGLVRQVVTASPGQEVRQLLGSRAFGAVLVHLEGGADGMDLADFASPASLSSGPPLIIIAEGRPDVAAAEYVPAAFARDLLTERVACVLELRRLKAERASDEAQIAALTSEVQRLGAAVAEAQRTSEALRQRLGEQLHRGKNLLAILQSVAFRTIGSGREGAVVRDALMGRFRALARAHQLVAAGDGTSVEMADAVEAALGDTAHRVTLSGPPVRLAGSVVQTFMLALHELADNAVRHGALGSEDGVVTLGWTFFEQGHDRYLEVAWNEQGGPVPAAPVQYGFGLTLVSSFAARAPTPSITFGSDGMTCRMRLSQDVIASG